MSTPERQSIQRLVSAIWTGVQWFHNESPVYISYGVGPVSTFGQAYTRNACQSKCLSVRGSVLLDYSGVSRQKRVLKEIMSLSRQMCPADGQTKHAPI